jgi:hypothetical protein
MFAADSNGEITVVLNLAEDISLQEDYTIRELVNRVQRLRKEVDAGETLDCFCRVVFVFGCSLVLFFKFIFVVYLCFCCSLQRIHLHSCTGVSPRSTFVLYPVFSRLSA